MNAFIDYINSMHSIKGDGLGALAERQIQSPYSQPCHVPRRLGEIIASDISSGENRAYIITGHAGDGKTSILVQVLRALGMLRPGELLKDEEICESGRIRLYYVKDMSEVQAEQRVAFLKRALTAPARGMSSILISNTGPLLSSFEDLLREDCTAAGEDYDATRRLANQTELLDQLDRNLRQERSIGGYSFSMINIARIDNVSFAGEFLDRILQDHLWLPCEGCAKRDRCPIHHNYVTVKENCARVKAFIDAYLRYSYAFDQRLTIRQIQAQICYALTGGMNCDAIGQYRGYSPFKYGFANLFFGYQGSDANDAALKVKAIRMLHDMNLDAIALPIDYDLFVKGATGFFPAQIRGTLESEVLQKLKRLNRSGESDVKDRNRRMIALRRSLRRYCLLFGELDRASLFDRVFGTGFSLYEEVSCRMNVPRPKLKSVRDYLFGALYLNNTGFLPQAGADSYIPLTLHRKDGIFQSVMLVLGHVPKSEMNILQRPAGCDFEDNRGRQQLALEVRGRRFDISLPLFLYFVKQSSGAVTPACNPALTHNITRLESLLADAFRSAEAAEIELLINTTKGQQYQSLYISEDKIHLD